MASSVAPTTTSSCETEAASSSTSTFFHRKEAEAKAIIAQEEEEKGKVDDDNVDKNVRKNNPAKNCNNNITATLSSALSTLSSENDGDSDVEFYTPPKKQQQQQQQIIDNDNNAAVLLLAERLAPELEKAEDVFTVPKEFQRANSADMRTRNNTEDDDDDDFGREVEELEMAEELLRQELEQATAFSNLFASSSYSPQRNDIEEVAPTPPAPAPLQQPSVSEADMDDEDQKSPEKYSGLFLSSSAMRRRLRLQSPSSATVSTPSKQKSITTSTTVTASSPILRTPASAAAATAITTTPATSHQQHHQSVTASSTTATDITCLLHVGQKPVPYHIADHRQALQLQLDQYTTTTTFNQNNNNNSGGAAASWYMVDLTQHVVTTSSSLPTLSASSLSSFGCWGIKEYCFAMSESKLKHRYVGLPADTVGTSMNNNIAMSSSSSSSPVATAAMTNSTTQPSVAAPLPIRTIVIQIRPDVLCGAVMDAAHQGIGRSQQVEMSKAVAAAADINSDSSSNASMMIQYCSSSMTQVLKRQGGHLRAIVTLNSNTAAGATRTAKANLSFLMDVQLCTYKSPECDRRLLIRVYHSTPGAATTTRSSTNPNNDNKGESSFDATLANETTSLHNPYGSDDHSAAFMMTSTTMEASMHLREACALIQRMDAVASPRSSSSSQYYYHNKLRQPAQSPTLSDRDGMKETVSAHLLGQYKALPSVKEGNITLPALNSDDWVVIQASWPFVQAMWDELESRDLTCTTMMTSSPSARFGAFPALPTLDVHYCSQIRRYSRETMIVQLLKSASDLEEWAREAEYACANMISLLQPAFESYGIPAPPLPRPVPLTSFPLQFTPPQTACPPWGVKVMEALNEIQKWTGDAAVAAAAANSQEQVFSLSSSIKRSTSEGSTSSASSSPFLPSLLLPRSMDEEGAQKSLAMARRAVNLVWMAFQQQDDDEKGARLERKNVQVMDRLAKMQAHQRASISAIQRAGCKNNDDTTAISTRNEGQQPHQSPSASLVSGEVWSEKASKAADEFLAKSGGKAREVPLVKWSVVVGSSTGTCWVTQNYILFVTQLIPVIGGSTTRLFLLHDSEFVVEEEAPASLLNPLPTVISLHYHPPGESDNDKEVYTFRPSVGGARLKSLLDSVKALATETPLE